MPKRRHNIVGQKYRQQPRSLDHANASIKIIAIESLQEFRPRPSFVALRGSGAGLWSYDAESWVKQLRAEW